MYRRNHIYYNKKIYNKGEKRMAQENKILYSIDFDVNKKKIE